MGGNGKFIAVLSLLVMLMMAIGKVYLSAQTYTDNRVSEVRQEVREDLKEIKGNQKEQGMYIKEVLEKLNQLQGAQEERERRRASPSGVPR